MSDLTRTCVFCGRPRLDVNGRMMTVRSVVPEYREEDRARLSPDVSVCWNCLGRPIVDLLVPLRILIVTNQAKEEDMKYSLIRLPVSAFPPSRYVNELCRGARNGGDCHSPVTGAWMEDGSLLCWSCDLPEHNPQVAR